MEVMHIECRKRTWCAAQSAGKADSHFCGLVNGNWAQWNSNKDAGNAHHIRPLCYCLYSPVSKACHLFWMCPGETNGAAALMPWPRNCTCASCHHTSAVASQCICPLAAQRLLQPGCPFQRADLRPHSEWMAAATLYAGVSQPWLWQMHIAFSSIVCFDGRLRTVECARTDWQRLADRVKASDSPKKPCARGGGVLQEREDSIRHFFRMSPVCSTDTTAMRYELSPACSTDNTATKFLSCSTLLSTCKPKRKEHNGVELIGCCAPGGLSTWIHPTAFWYWRQPKLHTLEQEANCLNPVALDC